MNHFLLKSSSQSKAKVGRIVTPQQSHAEFQNWTYVSGDKQEIGKNLRGKDEHGAIRTPERS